MNKGDKKINFYFHDDVDGLTCSALFYDFIKKRGYAMGDLVPMSYGGKFYQKWQQVNLKSPSVVLDFRYHPSADWFFDHHTSSFMTPEWQRDFKADERHFFDENYPSCFGYVYDMLVKNYDFKPSRFMQKLRPEVDMLDSAKYPSARYYVLLEGPIAQFDILLEKLRKRNAIQYKYFIKALDDKSISSILKIKKYARIIKSVKEEIKLSLKKLPEVIDIKNSISIVDATKIKTHLPRFSYYYLFPELEYSISIKNSKGIFSVSVGKNPWSKKESALHLGKLQENYGGGGHKDAAGSECMTLEEAMNRAVEIREKITDKL